MINNLRRKQIRENKFIEKTVREALVQVKKHESRKK